MSDKQFWQAVPSIPEDQPASAKRNNFPLFKSVSIGASTQFTEQVKLQDLSLPEFMPYIKQQMEADEFYKITTPSSFRAGATNTQARPLILKVILGLCGDFKQHPKTRHLAIMYADLVLTLDPSIITKRFKSGHLDPKDGLKYSLQQSEFLIGCVCVLLASKFCEIDDNLIMVSDIQRFHCKFNDLPWKRHDPPLSYDSVVNSELQYLLRLEWNLHRLLPLDLLQVIQHFVGLVLPNDSSEGNSPNPAISSPSRGLIEDSGRVRRPRKFRSAKFDLQFSPCIKASKNVSLQVSVEEMAFADCDLAIEHNFEFSSFTQLEIAAALIIKARAAHMLSTIPEYTNELEAKLKTRVDQYRVQTCVMQIQKIQRAALEEFPSVSNHSLVPSIVEKGTPSKTPTKALDKSPICTAAEMISQLGWSSKNDQSVSHPQGSASPFQGEKQLSELQPSPLLVHRAHSPLEVRWRNKNKEHMMKVLQSQDNLKVDGDFSKASSTYQSLRKKNKQPSTNLNLPLATKFFLESPQMPLSSEGQIQLATAFKPGQDSAKTNPSPLVALTGKLDSLPSIDPPKDSDGPLKIEEFYRSPSPKDQEGEAIPAMPPAQHLEPDSSSYFFSMGELEVRSIIGKIPRQHDSRTSSEMASPIANYATVPQKQTTHNFIQSSNIQTGHQAGMDSSLQALSSILNPKVSSLAIAASKKASNTATKTVHDEYMPAGKKKERRPNRVEFTDTSSFNASTSVKPGTASKSKARSSSKFNLSSVKAQPKKNLFFKDNSVVQLRPKVSFQDDDRPDSARLKKGDRGKSNVAQRKSDFFSRNFRLESGQSTRRTSIKAKEVSRNTLKPNDQSLLQCSMNSISKPHPQLKKKATTSNLFAGSVTISAQPKPKVAKKAGSLIKMEKKTPTLTKTMSRPTLALEMNQSKKKTFLPQSATKLDLISPRMSKARLSPLASLEAPVSTSGKKFSTVKNHVYQSTRMSTIKEKGTRQPSISLKQALGKLPDHNPLDSARKTSKHAARSSSKMSSKKPSSMYHKVVISQPETQKRPSESKKDKYVNIFRQNNSLAAAKGSPDQSGQNQRTQASESPTKQSDSPIDSHLKKSLGVSPLSEEYASMAKPATPAAQSDAISKLTSRISNLKQRKLTAK